jgi:hypothetical protein
MSKAREQVTVDGQRYILLSRPVARSTARTRSLPAFAELPGLAEEIAILAKGFDSTSPTDFLRHPITARPDSQQNYVAVLSSTLDSMPFRRGEHGARLRLM